ncbi:hypothetical protein ACHQM5_010067 [Ranunculus cassubicifolius]
MVEIPANSSTAGEALQLPLQLIKSETIPPSPDRNTIDCLLHYSGYSWIAYGASSLLVISHLPSPHQTLIAPIYRQVIDLPSSSTVKALAWSPSLPSHAEIAVSVDNLVCLYADTSLGGSFNWSQVAVLVQCYTVDALKWTSSGDGIVTVGVEVVLWTRKDDTSWELASKFTPNHPQNMVSATWSTQGPVATGGMYLDDIDRDGNGCVLVCQMDDKGEFVRRSELRHPKPVLMIQWRPSSGADSHRDVLLTCCVDGTARLWVEIDTGRAKNTKQCFHVIAVIEVNHSLNGILGVDTFVTWATEMSSSSSSTHGGRGKWEGSASVMPGACEWLIGYGPHMLLTFWAVHCLDDASPLRFPRVTLWKTLDLAGEEGRYLQSVGNLNSKDHSVFIKAVVSRSQLHGPPTMCSLLQLLSDNAIGWSHLPTLESSNTLGESFSLDGHSGNILQVDVHPYSCEVELAVSLDSNGLLLFWSLSTFSSSIIGMPARLLPTWKLVGKMATKQLFSVEYTCLCWAPSVSNGHSVLLLGHLSGIDCFMIEIAKAQGENIAYHKLCTIPFTVPNHADGPTSIYAMTLPCSCTKSFLSNRFMLLGIWASKFQALSWRVTLHTVDSSESCCDCNFDVRGDVAELDGCRYESSFAGRWYCLVTETCSSTLPDSPIFDQVTSFAAAPPGSLMPCVQQKWPASNGFPCKSAPYQIATGHTDGSLRLWRSSCSKLSTLHSEPWELVGIFNAHQERITAISLSCCGGKIATVSMANYQDNVGVLCIWQPVHIMDVGNFLLEDKICLDGMVVAMNWFSIGNGQLLLGVCMKNELRIYAQKNFRSQTIVDSGELLQTQIWYCIATSTTSMTALDFIWGPGATPVLVHEKYFSLFSKWSFHMDKQQSSFCAQLFEENGSNCIGETDKELFATVFTDCSSCKINTLSSNWITKKCNPDMPSKLSANSDHPVDNLFSTIGEPQYNSGKCLRSILEVAGEIRGSLPIYHPEALLLNLFSGNWRRACIALRHLVGHLTSNNTSVKNGKTYDHIPNKGIPQILLSKYYEEPYSTVVGDKGLTWGIGAASVSSLKFQQNPINSFGYNEDDNGPNNRVTPGSGKSEISGFIETIEKCTDITAVTSFERRQMLAVLDLLLEISDSSCASAYESLDEPGRRFWVELNFQQHFLRRFGGLEATNVLVVDSCMIGWAFLSDCQDNLITSILPNEPSWQDMRNLGAGFWFLNTTQLRTRMEKLARSQYLKKRDPKDCALLYIALNRLQVLAGLFKVSRDEKDKPLVGFLSRDFQDEKNKAAALKNAYVLMGRHQLELAIAFFLLGGDTSSAVSVCAKTLGDEQLALVICRLIEGNGGPLERHLISKILLPASIDRGDCWLASLFEWTLGNYFLSLLRLLGHGMDLIIDRSVLLSSRSAFLDPKVGQYCLVLAITPFMKNSIGESAAGALTRWAALMTSIAFYRRGLPVEALQSLSYSLGSIETKDDGIPTDLERHGIPHGILTHNDASNWLSGDVSLHVESNFKLDLALHNISYLVVEHPSWIDITLSSLNPLVSNKYTSSAYKISLVNFQHKLNSELRTFEQKYSLDFVEMLNMILAYSCNHGVSFIGYHILHGYTSPEFPRDEDCSVDSVFQYLSLPELFLRASEEVSCFLNRYLICCSIIYPPPHSSFPTPKISDANRSHQLHLWDVYMKRSLQLLESLRAILMMYSPNFLTEDLMMETCTAIDLLEYYLVFTSAWRHTNLRRLLLTIQPILITYNNGHIPSKVGVENLKKHLCENLVLLTCDSSTDDVGGTPVFTCKQDGDEISLALLESIPDDEKWLILGICLWRHLFNFTRDLMKSYPDSLSTSCSSKSPLGANFSSTDCNGSSDSGKKCTNDGFRQVPLLFVNSLNNSLEIIASSHERQLASVLSLKLERGFYVPTLLWLENSSHSHSSSSYNFLKQDIGTLMSNEDELYRVLWEISVDPKEVCKFISQENMSWLKSISRKLSKGWTELRKGSWNKLEKDDTLNDVEGSSLRHSANGEGGSPAGRYPPDNSVFLKSRSNNSTITKGVTLFQNPEEIYKRNGELLEGILFFNWKDEEFSNDHSEYIWSLADWPQNGWAGSESTPVPTFVSQGIGLGSKKGAHLGLGGATIGMGERAFGIPGYGSVGASDLGWGTQEDFEFDDPPATVDNISTRALCSHPARPFFLAGSSNTHIYLWEFGKDKAVATYGVLPAANVPPPYALASIEALQFDNYGHRFVTAALDGTICTWQLEVGGRSNIHPTESSLCFNGHALDVTYVGASGSVIAAAGYSSDDVNVVIWDTLAPATTSQASLVCHEGGARSVSVFDKNIGSGSVSPLIVTGGRGGDIGLHDFRFIATGKSKRHKQSNKGGGGMLWYIPKAHVGSITSIAVVPDSSFFLTGGKDGDVKLWDANKSQLVFHWPKLHERHTFLQPSSRGFGGIVRAAVTDIQVVSNGFLTCGGDGTVKMVLINNFADS